MTKASKQFKSGHRILSVQKFSGKPQVAVKGSGANLSRQATIQMKRVVGGTSLVKALGEAGETARLATLQALETTDYTHDRVAQRGSQIVPLATEKEALAEVLGGADPRFVEQAYDLSRGFVQRALSRRYGSVEAAKQALQGALSEVALACSVKAMEQVPNMTGSQAVMGAAIAVDKVLALEKSIAEKPKTINFEAFAQVGRTLKVLKEIVGDKRP